MKKRIYVVTRGEDTFLIKATNKIVAINYVAKKDVDAKVASQDDLIKLIATNQIEEA
ncbi:MAG: hypothetical protein ACWGQW_05625 [bacterium]